MGVSISWIAVQTDKHDSLFDIAKVTPTDEEDEYFESRFSGSALNNGWFLLVGQRCDNRLVQRDILTSLSELGPTIACSIEEHVMYSSASHWNSGSEIWSVSHDAQKSMFNLEFSGELPTSFESFKAKIIKQQNAEGGEKAEVDLIFDIPLFLALEVTGFKHDEVCESLDQPNPVVFEDKNTIASADKRPWWKWW